MTSCSPDIWELHRQCIVYRIESIGRGYVTTLVLTWHLVLYCFAPMGHVDVGHRWDRVAMDLLDMSVTTAKGNRHVLVMVDCFSRWTEACPLPDKTALAVADAFFQHIVCRFGMPMVIHSDQGREFENKVMHYVCYVWFT